MDNWWRCTSSGKPPPIASATHRAAKNLIMENLYKVKHLESQFKNVIFAHDMTKQERTECKMLVEDVKKQTAEDSMRVHRQ